jgi:uncharacterized protein (TIGR00725 family)
MNCMKAIIGVMGARTGHATRQDIRLAYRVGRLVAQLGAVVLTGGITGVMAASGRGAWDCGGTVLSIGPDNDRRRLNPFIDLAVITGMGPGRNFLNVLSSNIVVAVGRQVARHVGRSCLCAAAKKAAHYFGRYPGNESPCWAAGGQASSVR